MPILTNPRHEAFAQYFFDGCTATEAYERAGYKVQYAAARANASRLLTKDNVQARIAELQERRRKQADVTVESLKERLEKNIEFAKELNQPAPINKSIELIGRLYGHFEKVKQDEGSAGPTFITQVNILAVPAQQSKTINGSAERLKP